MTEPSDFKRLNIYEDEGLIEKALNFLKFYDPEHATREDAISLLAFMQTTAKEVSNVTTQSFEDYYKAYKKKQ